ncbi:polysaccharide lyase [Kitasatospora sp. NBC_01246]|uniref:heparin lyase I family protein n=1 Tax=Kitasatospora sp. NBC_01246 TaxID=2903570 RepID=UPI002E328F07|nr:heparin lyase I family protein [Kitasatospora sp. NBC_01246]
MLSRPNLAGAVLTALVAVGLVGAPEAAAASVAYDFESSDGWPYMALNGFGRVSAVPAPAGGSGRAARFNVPNDGRSFKTELVMKNLGAGSHRFSFGNYLPNDWPREDFGTIVAQWFSTQGDDNDGVKPVVALSLNGQAWLLKVHWLEGAEVRETVVPLGTVQFGHWNRWVVDITWSTPSSPGSIVVVRDGVQVGSHTGENNYHRGEAPHFRIGIYRPTWRPEKKVAHSVGGPDAVLYVDDVSITDVTAGAPAAPPSPAARTTPPPSQSATGTPAASAPAPTASPKPSATAAPTATPSPTPTGETAAPTSQPSPEPDDAMTRAEAEAALPVSGGTTAGPAAEPSPAAAWIGGATAFTALACVGGVVRRRHRGTGRRRRR